MPPAESRARVYLTAPVLIGFADVDGDGAREFCASNRAGWFGAWRHDGAGMLAHDFGESPPAWIAVGDVDGDGAAEILTCTADSTTLWRVRTGSSPGPA